MRRVRAPHSLIGGGFAGHSDRVTIWDIFKDGDRWAYGSEPHQVYSIPDPELIFDWISSRSPQKDMTLVPSDVSWSSGEFVRRNFEVKYPVESRG